MNAEALFLDHLPYIERVIGFIQQRYRLPPDEAEDYDAWVKMRLIDRDYALLRKHRGESRLTTYLTTVIHNLFRDYRNHKWGKFRPSAAARRLGPEATQLETLLVRDGLGTDEAVEQMKVNHRVGLSRSELHQLAAQLPARTRRSFTGTEDLEGIGVDGEADRGVEDGERATVLARTEEVLARALRTLSGQDLLILKMHYRDGRTIAAIASVLRLKQRPLYNRREACLRRLKAVFKSEDLEWDEVRRILGWERTELQPVWESQRKTGGEPISPNEDGEREQGERQHDRQA